ANRPELYMGGIEEDEETMEQAIKLVETEISHTADLMGLVGTKEDEKIMEDILFFLNRQPGRKALRTEISKRFGRRIGSAWDLDKLEGTMRDRGYIEVILEKTSNKARKPAKFYRALRRRARD